MAAALGKENHFCLGLGRAPAFYSGIKEPGTYNN